MYKMKRCILLLIGLVTALGLSAQNPSIPMVLDIASVDTDGKETEVVNIPRDGVNHYYLHVGSMGIGNSIISVDFDPVDRLFVPLGNTLSEAILKMEELKALLKEPKGTSIEIQASFGPLFPSDFLQAVQVSRFQPLLTNYLEFTINQGEYDRIAHISRADFNALLSAVKFYGKIHPKEM